MMTTPGELHLDLTSDPHMLATSRRDVEAFVAAHGFGEVAVGDIGLCVNEALANVIRHAYGGDHSKPIVVEAKLDPGIDGAPLVITVRDWGDGRVPDLRRPPPDPSALTPGGLGLPCLKQLLDGVQFIPQPDGMLLKMIRRRR